MFEKYDFLSFFSKYYFVSNDGLKIEDNFKSILKKREDNNILDTTSLVELVNKNYMFGDRTLVKGIYRTPWMARPNNQFSDWERKEVNITSKWNIDEKEIANELFKLLQEEIIMYCHDKRDIGILLSGGMDSRIIAGILYSLIKEKVLNINVIALTWGVKNSRDVVYAEKLAKSLNWEWVHLNLSPDSLLENIKVTAELGCEFSPIHLHAIPRVRELEGLDCILAASYGDSIGRATYSGKHVNRLKPINRRLVNRYGMFDRGVFHNAINEANQDIKEYQKLYPQDNKLSMYELDLQRHYLRRQLNSCMGYINEKIPLFQTFTSPKIYEYMWSINPKFRTDKIYSNILHRIDDLFLRMPWSKTGKGFMSDEQKADNYYKEHHMYGKWIRNDLHEVIKSNVLSSNIESLNIFNMDALENIINLNKHKSKINKHSRIDELLIWIASLTVSIEKFSIETKYSRCKKNPVTNKIRNTAEINAYLFYKNNKK